MMESILSWETAHGPLPWQQNSRRRTILRTAEMTLEDDYGMIDGVINNGRRGEGIGKAQEYAERTTPEKPSIRERLEDAKRECAEHKPPEGKKPGRDVPEHDCL